MRKSDWLANINCILHPVRTCRELGWSAGTPTGTNSEHENGRVPLAQAHELLLSLICTLCTSTPRPAGWLEHFWKAQHPKTSRLA